MIEFELQEDRLVADSINAFVDKLTEAKDAFIFHQFEVRGISKQEVIEMMFNKRLVCLRKQEDMHHSTMDYFLDNEPLFRITDICDPGAGTIELKVLAVPV